MLHLGASCGRADVFRKPRVKGEKCDVFLNVEEQWRIFFVACLR